MDADAVLHFWFDEIRPEQWWESDADFDARIRERFLSTLESAARGELHPWRDDAAGRLAEVIVLDQFSRNIQRRTPRSFAQDPMALALAQEAVSRGAHEQLEPERRTFLLMPYMHSESTIIHVEAERLFREWTPQTNHDFELRHKLIIDRFGRYPHRNVILGRASTPEELEFLVQPGSGF